MDRTINFVILHVGNIIAGFLAAAASYFAPAEGFVIVTFAAIIIDLFTGAWAGFVKREGVQSKKLWRTGSKLLLAFTVISLAHSIDVEMGVQGITFAKCSAWFFVGFEFWSILENATVISDWPVFRALSKYMRTEVKEKTGIDLNEKDIQ
ncbi:phage holin family protein [Mangrovibacterium sp.]|uniref:phage holin family protein n=1 Tax=Mangrovibacterium sp. TaxID=1961364 RepID=UPI003566DBEB